MSHVVTLGSLKTGYRRNSFPKNRVYLLQQLIIINYCVNDIKSVNFSLYINVHQILSVFVSRVKEEQINECEFEMRTKKLNNNTYGKQKERHLTV